MRETFLQNVVMNMVLYPLLLLSPVTNRVFFSLLAAFFLLLSLSSALCKQFKNILACEVLFNNQYKKALHIYLSLACHIVSCRSCFSLLSLFY